MSLDKVLKDLDEKIKESDVNNEDAEKKSAFREEVVEESNDEASESEQEPSEKEPQEEVGASVDEDSSDEEGDSEDEPKDKTAAAMARMRREKAEAERKNKELMERLERLEGSLGQKKDQPDRQQTPEQQQQALLAQIAFKERMQEAKEELSDIEAAYSQEVADYEDVKKHAISKEIKAMKRRFPDVPESQLKKQIENDLLFLAADFHAKGLNPAEEIYQFAKDRYGYQGSTENQKKRPSVDMDAVKRNKSKSVNLMDSAGKSSKTAPLSSKEISEMSIAEQYKAAKQGLWEE